MDTFVKRFFPNYESPGITFQVRNSITESYMRELFQLTIDGATQLRDVTHRQKMTTAGIVTASIKGAASSYHGINKSLLTPEGSINLETLVGSSYDNRVVCWPWNDNHVALLVNMLRFTLLRAVTEADGNLNVQLEEYNDGRVRIDRNQWWPPNYPAVNDWAWPGGDRSENYPEFTRLDGPVPISGDNCIDVGHLSESEATFVLLMTGAWNRRSRHRLDFDTPRLCESLLYRSVKPITALVGPALPTVRTAWGALQGYVRQNRLYDQFSTALYLVSAAMYQFLPATAEGQIWLSFDWRLSIPEFSSIRGRYCSINEGDGDFVSSRARSEWGYIGNSLEKINLMALVCAQAAQTGLAVRSTRHGLEENPNDLFDTVFKFLMLESFYSSAMSEAVGFEAPISGMRGANIYIDVNFDEVQEGMSVKIDDDTIEEEVVRTRCLDIKIIPLAGYPTLIAPLSCFPYNTPLDLAGEINKEEIGGMERRGWRVDLKTAWRVSHLLRLAGYDISIRPDPDLVGPTRFFAPDEVNMVWPLMKLSCGPLIINGQVELERQFMCVPCVYNLMWRGSMTYRGQIHGKGVISRPNSFIDICDYGRS